jgi:hypothetical protein
MKHILIIIFFVLFAKVSSQERELLIDTVFIKTFSNEKTIETIKQSKKQYKKYYVDFGIYTANLSLTADNEKVSDFSSSDFTFKDFMKKEYKKYSDDSFYKDVKVFEFNPGYPEYELNQLYNFPNFNCLNYFKNYNYKMREIDDVLQITCYSKNSNLKAVIILDKKTLLPKTVYRSSINPTYNVSQTYSNIMKNTDSEVTYDIVKNEATIFYETENNKITISEIDSDLLMGNYRIRRTNKKGDLVFSKNLKIISSKVNLKKK